MKRQFDEKQYEDLTFTDDFMFCKVLENDEELSKELLELILDVKIRKAICQCSMYGRGYVRRA